MHSSHSRRHFLRSATGAALSLPWLPSLANNSRLETKAPTRFALFYSPIGVVRKGFFPGESDVAVRKFRGMEVHSIEGAEFTPGFHPLELTPSLEPLHEVRDSITLITGLDRTFQNGTDVHAQCGSCFLSSASPYEVEGSAWPLKRTLDHIIADQIGGVTPFRTLEFSANSHKDNKESIYFDNISWFGTGHVAPSLRDPLKAYNTMFSMGNSQNELDITDLVLADAKSLQRKLGQEDKNKFEEYYESVREIERRIGKMQALKGSLTNIPLAAPTGAYLPRGEYISLMGDLMIAALQTGLTRVATFMAGPERWDTPFLFESLFDGPRSHHGMSHKPEEYENDLLKLDQFHVAQYARLVEKMKSITEADGSSLLDNTIFTYGSGLGDGSTHQYNDLPIIVAGHGQEGRHLAMPSATPLANLWLTQAKKFGYSSERFADSTGVIKGV